MQKPIRLAACMLATISTQALADGKGDFLGASPNIDWSGLYAGASIGFGWGEATQNYDRAGDHGAATLEPDGATGSAIAGYNWMLNDQWLVGVEGELGVLGVSQGATEVFDGHIWSSEFGPFMSTLRGRVGYAFGDVVMYGTGGLALAGITDISIGNTPGETASEDNVRAGWAIGFGADYALDNDWRLRGEFLHMDFGRKDGLSDNAEAYSFDNSLNLLRVGLTRSF